MKEPARVIHKGLCLTGDFIDKSKSPLVLSKRFLIHPARSCLTWQAGQTASSQKFNYT